MRPHLDPFVVFAVLFAEVLSLGLDSPTSADQTPAHVVSSEAKVKSVTSRKPVIHYGVIETCHDPNQAKFCCPKPSTCREEFPTKADFEACLAFSRSCNYKKIFLLLKENACAEGFACELLVSSKIENSCDSCCEKKMRPHSGLSELRIGYQECTEKCAFSSRNHQTHAVSAGPSGRALRDFE